jgi:Beta protein
MYVPLLKGKEGEFAALETLRDDVRDSITPLIEVPDVPYDHANERAAKSLDQHVAGIADRLRRCWNGRRFYLDLPWFENDQLADGRPALARVLADCIAVQQNAVPVISTESSGAYLTAAAAHAVQHRTGTCIRLAVDDFDDESDPVGEVERLLIATRLTRAEVDLLVDLGELGSEPARNALVARSVFQMLGQVEGWRSLILAAASFPSDLSEVSRSTVTTLPRREWNLWRSMQRRPPRPDLIFGDYAIAHPTPKELDPRTMRMSASIRYTTDDQWLVVKGQNVRQYGFDQYFDLCASLVQRPEYRGEAFSWGDGYIAGVARREQGPGNATTWRKVGTNHHLTLVARALANPAVV